LESHTLGLPAVLSALLLAILLATPAPVGGELAGSTAKIIPPLEPLPRGSDGARPAAKSPDGLIADSFLENGRPLDNPEVRLNLTTGNPQVAFGEGGVNSADRYVTYLGGMGSEGPTVFEPGAHVANAVDGAGNVYVAGWTTSADFPVTQDAFDATFDGGSDAFVAKLDPSGQFVLYATYLGGAADDGATSIKIDAVGNAYVAGWTKSADFPVTSGAFDTTLDFESEAFVVKLVPSGGSLAYATYLGEGGANSFAVDAGGSAYVAKVCCAGINGGWVGKLDPAGGSLMYVTEVGDVWNWPPGWNMGWIAWIAVTVDAGGNAYLAGWSNVGDGGQSDGGCGINYGGNMGWFERLSPAGVPFYLKCFVTSFGGNALPTSIAVDGAGWPYIAGDAAGISATPGAFDTTFGNGSEVFAAKLHPNGIDLDYVTYLGGSGSEVANSITVDSAGNAYVVGWTDSPEFLARSGDAFVVGLNATGGSLVRGAFLAGGSSDSATSVAVDATAVYISGVTSSSDFPVTADGFDTSFDGDSDAFVAKLAHGPLIPDLLLSAWDIGFVPPGPVYAGTIVSIDASVHNLGDGNATGVWVRLHDGIPDGSNQVGADQFIPLIASFGGLGNVRVNWTAEPPGLHNICVVADPDDAIGESNETNNHSCETIDVLPRAPDLAILAGDVGLSPAPPYRIGDQVWVNATVRNIGTDDSAATVARLHDGLPPSYQVGTDEQVPPLPAGGWGAWEAIGAGPSDIMDVALDPTGNGIAVWTEWDGINQTSHVVANRYVAGVGWEGAEPIGWEPGDDDNPRVAVDPWGNAIAMWRHSNGPLAEVWESRYWTGMGWGAAEPIGTAGPSFSSDVAADDAGNFIAVWIGPGTNVVSRRYMPVVGWGPVEPVETEPGDATSADLDVDQNGNAIAVWSKSAGTQKAVWANRYLAGAGWRAAEPISVCADTVNPVPMLAMDALGNAVAVWEWIGGPVGCPGGVWASRFEADVGWGVSNFIGTGIRPAAANDRAGNAIATWVAPDGDRFQALARRYIVGVGWSTTEIVGPASGGLCAVGDCGSRIAMDDIGNAVAVWTGLVEGYYPFMWANRYEVGVGWDTAATIDTDEMWNAFRPEVAIDSDGNAMVVWRASGGGMSAIRSMASGRVTVSFPWTASLPPSHDLCVVVDPDDLVDEGNETNNVACATVLVQAPDYVPANPQPTAAIVGLSLPLTISLEVLNAGDISATAAVWLVFSNESTPETPFATFSVPPIDALNRSGRFEATWISPAIPGTHRVVADADYGDHIAEGNESNNLYTWSMEVVNGPVTTLGLGFPSHTAGATYVTSATPLSLSVVDRSGTGVRATNVWIDMGPWSVYTGPFTLTGEGEHVVRWYSEDNAGNIESSQYSFLQLDDTPPSTTLTIGYPKYVAGGTFVTSSTPISLDAIDGGTMPIGPRSVEYRIDGDTWVPYVAPFMLTGEGARRIEYRSTDLLGNAEVVASIVVTVDDTPPTVSLQVGSPSYSSTYTWVTSSTPLEAMALDLGVIPVGLDRAEYRIDGGQWVPYTSPFSLLGGGPHTVEARAVDLLGNGASSRVDLVVDDIAPATTIAPSAGPYNTDNQFTLVASDSGSGVAITRYRVDSDPSIEYTAPFALPAGSHTVSYGSEDVLGNPEAEHTLDVRVGLALAPATALIVGPPNWDAPPVYVTSGTPLVLAATDRSGLGLRTTSYRHDGGAWTDYASTGPFSLSGEVEHLLEWFSDDLAGNVEPMQSAILRVDDTPPVVSLDLGDPQSNIGGAFVTTETLLTLRAADDGMWPVGIASMEFRIGEGPWTIYGAPFELPVPDGAKRVEYGATDYLGNHGSGTLDLIVDDTPPRTTIFPVDSGAGPSTEFILASVDDGSGVAWTEYWIDDSDPVPYAAGFSLLPGNHVIGYRSADRLNNVEAEQTLAVTVAEPSSPETNWKPLIASAFSFILVVAGIWSARRRPWRGESSRGSMRTAFAFTSLPFVIAEAATGILSHLTGLLSIPPIMGPGTVVDVAVLVAGAIVAIRRATPSRRA